MCWKLGWAFVSLLAYTMIYFHSSYHPGAYIVSLAIFALFWALAVMKEEDYEKRISALEKKVKKLEKDGEQE